MRSAITRAVAVAGLALRRLRGRLATAPGRLLLSVLGVALAVGLMITVTGVSLGLASESVVQSEGVDYWVVPEQSTVSTVAVSTGSVQLGDAHSTTVRVRADDRVQYATPVLLELFPATDRTTDEREYVMAVGIVPEADGGQFSGMPTDSLSPGDPYYANGSYNGPWTGDVVLNDAAAGVLNASVGDDVRTPRTGPNQTLTVRNVTAGGIGFGPSTAPVMLLHLSELQTLTGGAAGDHADQILVTTNDPSVRSTLTGLYPRTTVVTRNGLSAQDASLSNLPLAVAAAALLIGSMVGVLFVATLMGLEVSASEQQLAVLGALGYPARRRMTLVAVESVTTSLLGGVVGSGLGVLGIVGLNALVAPRLGLETVARFDPLLLGYALGVTLLIGVLGMVYPVVLSRRTDILEVLAR